MYSDKCTWQQLSSPHTAAYRLPWPDVAGRVAACLVLTLAEPSGSFMSTGLLPCCRVHQFANSAGLSAPNTSCHTSPGHVQWLPAGRAPAERSAGLLQGIAVVCVLVWVINIGHFKDPVHGGWVSFVQCYAQAT